VAGRRRGGERTGVSGMRVRRRTGVIRHCVIVNERKRKKGSRKLFMQARGVITEEVVHNAVRWQEPNLAYRLGVSAVIVRPHVNGAVVR